ncbi:cytochrome c [Niastella caeni]|uniref:Cytochrome c n=1 Tax=Niastella caeni TaxID=2569763 RepID=A0A4S8HZU7_9BACT|nr:cytochrome c [Niastella caeni]THU41343.1 cytochrome c [Niastella caeni]
MNKEVNYVLQGFLLTLLFIGAFKFGGFLLSLPVHEDPNENKVMQGVCGNAAPVFTSDAVRGKTLFQENCASCHSIFKDMVGPSLAGVLERVPDKKLLYKWIRNPSAVLKSGNVYFNTLQKRYGTVMTPFTNLSDDEINAVLSYIDHHSK